MSVLLATTNFTGTDGAAWPVSFNGAVSGSLVGTKQIQTNTGQMTVGSANGAYGGNDRSSANTSLANTTTDAVVVAKVRFLNTTGGGVNATQDNLYPSIWVRANSTLDSASGYKVEIDPFDKKWHVVRVQAYGGTNTAPVADATTGTGFTVNTWYWIAFGVVGTNVRFQFWQDGTAQPTSWLVNATDSFIASGSVGLSAGKADVNGAKMQWDDVTVYSTFAEALPTAGTVTGATTFGSTITGMRTGSGAVTGASTFGSSVTGRRTDSRTATGASTFSASVSGVSFLGGSATGATTFGSSITGATTQGGSAQGDTVFNAVVTGTNQPVGQAQGNTVFGADVRGGVGLYFTSPIQRQHPKDRHPLIARTWIPVGVTLMKFGNSYRTYIDRDPELVAQADKVYVGGHLYFVDFAEVEALRQAGYGQWLSEFPPTSGGVDYQLTDYSQYGTGIYGTGPFGA